MIFIYLVGGDWNHGILFRRQSEQQITTSAASWRAEWSLQSCLLAVNKNCALWWLVDIR